MVGIWRHCSRKWPAPLGSGMDDVQIAEKVLPRCEQ